MSLLVGVIARPSRHSGDSDPGHLIVYWKNEDETLPTLENEARGFGFRVTDLPDGHQHQGQWRRYLFDHKVPGYVQDELMMLDDFIHHRSGFSCYNWSGVADDQLDQLEKLRPGERSGWYSFNPDDHPPEPIKTGMPPARCHNCVTWGIDIVNSVVGAGSLPKVRQGRIKLIVQLLENM